MKSHLSCTVMLVTSTRALEKQVESFASHTTAEVQMTRVRLIIPTTQATTYYNLSLQNSTRAQYCNYTQATVPIQLNDSRLKKSRLFENPILPQDFWAVIVSFCIIWWYWYKRQLKVLAFIPDGIASRLTKSELRLHCNWSGVPTCHSRVER